MHDPDHEARARVLYALRHPRGRYVAERASQLSGVPRSTLYDWRREEVYVPDYSAANPAAWSYRDLVFLRLLAWLRQLHMPRPKAAKGVRAVKETITAGEEVRRIRATPRELLFDEERMNRVNGNGVDNMLPFEDFYLLFRTFDLLDPVEELRSAHSPGRVWAPDLVAPSTHTFISPWVLAGDPCVERTRIPTAAIRALRHDRGLSSNEIVELYPGLTVDAAEDAYLLEQRLRGFGLPEPAAA
jgi:uncharacterized protein (DUF433 family)